MLFLYVYYYFFILFIYISFLFFFFKGFDSIFNGHLTGFLTVMWKLPNTVSSLLPFSFSVIMSKSKFWSLRTSDVILILLYANTKIQYLFLMAMFLADFLFLFFAVVVTTQRHHCLFFCMHSVCLQALSTNNDAESAQQPMSERPPYSYMAMIQFAINSKQNRTMTLKEIYMWIEEHFPYYREVAKPGWKVIQNWF